MVCGYNEIFRHMCLPFICHFPCFVFIANDFDCGSDDY